MDPLRLRTVLSAVIAAKPDDAADPDPKAEAGRASPPVYRCEGGCNAHVHTRGRFCPVCFDLDALRLRALWLFDAYASVTLAGALSWCRVELPEYAAATAKARAALEGLPEAERPAARELIERARWTRATGSLVILGPTGIGKSKILIALALRVLDYALRVGGDEVVPYASRIRLATGLDLARASAHHKLGDGEPPPILAAKSASLLLIDEIGFESTRYDPDAVRDVIYARYDAGAPTIVTSGCTVAEIEKRYGEAAMRRLWEPGRGRLVDLHPRGAAC